MCTQVGCVCVVTTSYQTGWAADQPDDYLTPDATLSFRVAFEPKDSYIFARGQNILIILPKPKELFELFGDEAKKRARTATKI